MKSGLEKFQESLLKESRKFTNILFTKHRDEFTEVFGRYLADSEGPKYLQKRLSREEEFFTTFFYLFGEIPRVYEFLLDIEVYIGRFPYHNTRITKINSLRYHIAVVENQRQHSQILEKSIVYNMGYHLTNIFNTKRMSLIGNKPNNIINNNSNNDTSLTTTDSRIKNNLVSMLAAYNDLSLKNQNHIHYTYLYISYYI